ncbi:MAG: hypothetical protein COV70_00635 [Parcubacteria group bacterium CG11_big_fil_rev_8_21_14_0_20_39_22]|nr:MAG: hypothetical protein COV70_00635 [Parcubacteria group bacterium CG11_big_fil_rev_8_21_14_0_20_39_22]
MDESSRLFAYITKKPLVYVCRDIERAFILPPDTEGYFIVTNDTPDGRAIKEKAVENVLLIKRSENENLISTDKLIEHPQTKKFLKKIGANSITVFKNDSQIEKSARNVGVKILNPSADMAQKIEDKISQVKWLGESARFLPKHEIRTLKDIKWDGKPFIIQFNHSYAGEGTHLIENERILNQFSEKFPNREIRKAKIIHGPVFTSNHAVTSNGVVHGNISYQITGLSPFTDNPFATVGNDFGLPKMILSKEQISKYREIAKEIGDKLSKEGYKGLFGIDIIMEEKSCKLYLLEINSRQTTNATFESGLQEHNNPGKLTIGQAHLMALLDIPVAGPVVEIRNGGQLVQRITKSWQEKNPRLRTRKLEEKGFRVFVTPYGSSGGKSGQEVVRIQNSDSLVVSHAKLNSTGREIAELLPINDVSVERLPKEATEIVDGYMSLFGKRCPCPYFNNTKGGVRASLKVSGGKGLPEEIEEEVGILMLRAHIDKEKMEAEDIRKFMIDHKIGVDCSGLSYNILNAVRKSRREKSLRRSLSYPYAKTPWRKIIARFRSIENTNVKTLAHDANSVQIKMQEVRPGDMITMIYEDKAVREYDHLLVVTEVERHDNEPIRIRYVNSVAWPSDGIYGHGVSEGVIHIEKPGEDITKQRWVEKGKEGEENYTLRKAKEAKVEVRRVNRC